MKRVWIVFHDSSPHNTILGVFDNAEDAGAYAEEIGREYENGALITNLPVPWRATDRRTVIDI